MKSFYERLAAHLESLQISMSFYQLHFKAGIGTSQFSLWKSGKRAPSDAEIQKLAAVPELGLTFEELQAWRIVDEYSLPAIDRAHELARKEEILTKTQGYIKEVGKENMKLLIEEVKKKRK